MHNKKWHQFIITIPLSHQDLLSGQLSMIGFTGFLQEQDSLSCYISTQVSFKTIANSLYSTLEKFANEFSQLHLTVSHKIIHEENWNAKWESQTGIVEATKSIIIKPSWKKLRIKDMGKIVLHIDPKMSFGTGHHETTRLSLALLERYLQKGDKIIDFGCGTGILAIACIKLGAHSAIAIDNDAWALSNARENVKKNKVETKVHVLLGSAHKMPNRTFDLIIANIDVPTITRFLHFLSKKVKKGNIIIFSGILTTDYETLIPLFTKQRLSVVEYIAENEWLAVALSKY
ncbi:MAG: 50S ribosomal protein L11 methyltransferase [Bacteroidota bacterium]